MVRTFKYFTVVAGGTPQPLVGTTTNAAVAANTDLDTPFTIVVLDSSMFLKGDWVVIGKPSSGSDRLWVQSVTDSTHIKVKGQCAAYPTATYIRLSNLLQSTFVQTKDGNAGTIFIGTQDNMVTATGVFVCAELTKVAAGIQPIEFHDGRFGPVNADDMGQFWVDGTTGDSYLPSFGVV